MHVMWVAVGLMISAVAQAQSNDIATGNMHFDAKDMDVNGDHMITKDEFMSYGEKMWGMMSKGADTISVHDASVDFARGNMRASVRAMDTDHDGTISKDEFMAYEGKRFDKVKDSKGMVSVSDATKYFARGNMHPDSKGKTP
jgi:hypothetical protein